MKSFSQESQGRYLKIIPLARMGSESMAHSAFGLMGYWLRGHEDERIIVLVKSN